MQSARAFTGGGADALRARTWQHAPPGLWPSALSPGSWEQRKIIPFRTRSYSFAGCISGALNGGGVPGGYGGNGVVPGDAASCILHAGVSSSGSSSSSSSSSRGAGGSGSNGFGGPAVSSSSGSVAGQQPAWDRTTRYEVYRIDDNDNTFVIGVYGSRTEAEAVAKEFEERRHKQIYLVREVNVKQRQQQSGS